MCAGCHGPRLRGSQDQAPGVLVTVPQDSCRAERGAGRGRHPPLGRLQGERTPGSQDASKERHELFQALEVDRLARENMLSPAPQRFEASIERWFVDTERFARQLREVTHDDYIAMKRGQYLRQQVLQ